MKFPKVTVVLVSAALLFVLWEQTRERPPSVDASRFTNLTVNPVERSVAMDWVVKRYVTILSGKAAVQRPTQPASAKARPAHQPAAVGSMIGFPV